MKKNLIIGLVLGSLVLTISCGNDEGPSGSQDNFDREAMLTFWADHMIMPRYEQYTGSLVILKTITDAFVAEPTLDHLTALRVGWIEAYRSWQYVSPFEIGKAEELSIRNYSNVFPINVSDMEATIASGAYNLTSVNKQDEQGFAAIDYLINGLADSDQRIIEIYLQETAGSNHGEYLTALVDRLQLLGNEVLNDWKAGYRETFIANNGSEATSSVNKLVNDLLFYYEKHLRAGKVGIPAGVFSSTPLSDRVEALYSQGRSKELLIAALDSYQDFFNGVDFDSPSETGTSLYDYLDFLRTITDGESLGDLINNQFDAARAVAQDLDDDFEAQVINDNAAMLQTYDELQKNVVYLKVDMLQAMNIRVDFVDADGD